MHFIRPPLRSLTFWCPKRRKEKRGPPIRFIAVEDNGCVFAYSIEASQLSKLCGIYVVTLDLILKIPSPIDVHRASDMSGVVKQNIFIALDDPVRRIV
jgi:hypothetical protein